jgi:ATP-dependent Clp protease protease subunit
MPKFWNFVKNAATETEPESVELRIEGVITDEEDAWLYEAAGMETITPNAFKTELAQFAGRDITVWINSPGGHTLAAAGIYTALKEHAGKVTVKIDGEACSAASVVAMSGDEVLMSPVALMMIHNPLTGAIGDANEMRHVADVLDEAKETLINAYMLKSGRSRKRIWEMMDAETYMSAKTAVREGFADGMLYAEAQNTDNMLNFTFSRSAIQNCTVAAMKRMVALVSPEHRIMAQNENDDLEKVNEIIKALPQDERKELGPRWFYDDAQYRYVEEGNGELIGFMENRATGKKGHLNAAVLPAYRGKGYAKSMVDRAIEAAPSIGCEKIFWITKPTNEASRKLAEKCGFELVSEDEDAVKYVLNLPPPGDDIELAKAKARARLALELAL